MILRRICGSVTVTSRADAYRTVPAGVSSLSSKRSVAARGALAAGVESWLSGSLGAQSCAWGGAVAWSCGRVGAALGCANPG
jgi:hypothetical protein